MSKDSVYISKRGVPFRKTATLPSLQFISEFIRSDRLSCNFRGRNNKCLASASSHKIHENSLITRGKWLKLSGNNGHFRERSARNLTRCSWLCPDPSCNYSVLVFHVTRFLEVIQPARLKILTSTPESSRSSSSWTMKILRQYALDINTENKLETGNKFS